MFAFKFHEISTTAETATKNIALSDKHRSSYLQTNTAAGLW